MAMVPAVLGSARLANFRLAYIPADMAAIRRTSVRILLGGVDVTARVRRHSVTIRDQLNDSPNTCSLVLKDDPPPPDVADLRVSVGTDQPTLLFSGTLQTSANTFTGRPGNLLYPVTALDDSARANRKRPFGKWTNVSATTVAKDVVAQFAPGFTTYGVQAGLEPISVTFDGSEGFTGALRAIAKLIGGYFYFLDLDLHLFTVESDPATLPDPIDYAHAFLYDPHIAVTRDFSQLRTRVYGRGLGVPLISDVTAGETLIPIENAVSFNPTGGKAIAESQILTYTGRQIGGAGSLVGPGAAPANAPVVLASSGSGIENGAHQWAVTFVTASGESLPGPVGVLTTGPLAPPAAALTIGTPMIGTGPDPGSHDYAVSFVTGAGETTTGPIATRATDLTSAPTTAVSLGTPTVGTGPDPGDHDYSVTFVTAIGETTPGPISSAVVTGNLPPPNIAPTLAIQGTSSAGVDPGAHNYAVTFVTAAGETTAGVSASITGPALAAPVVQPTFTPSGTAGSLTPGAIYYWSFTYTDGLGHETAGGPWNAPYVATATAASYTGATPNQFLGMRYVNVYRTTGNGGIFYLEFENYLPFNIQPGVLFGYNVTDAVLATRRQAPAPTPTIAICSIALSAIPIGEATVTGRKLYRTAANGSQLKFLANLNDNTTTTYLDTQADVNLGANAPTVNNGTPTARVPVTAIPTGDSNVNARKLYRRSAGAGFKLVTTISGNSATTYTDTKANAELGAAPPTVSTAYLQRMPLSGIPLAPPLVTERRIYRSPIGTTQLKFLTALANNSTTTFQDTVPDASLGANAPASNTATANQAALSSIPLGPAAVTSRKLYRTVAGGAALKALTTLADNTTTTYTDANPDGALGGAPPASDLSGLTPPTGQVLAGSTVLPVSSAGAPFAPTGGWVVIGAQGVRYTGISGNTLTGIPGAGQPGALINTVRYGEHVDAAPVLEGVTGLLQPAQRGITVSIWVQRDDLDAQAAMIAIDAAQGRTSDGVYEYRISDERRGEASLIALCDADLQQFSRPILTVTYATRDLKTKSGKPVTFNLDSPSLHGTLTIQDVTITDIAIAQNLLPTFTVSASSVRYSLEDLLRQLAAKVGV
jgi:hypothetical protein